MVFDLPAGKPTGGPASTHVPSGPGAHQAQARRVAHAFGIEGQFQPVRRRQAQELRLQRLEGHGVHVVAACELRRPVAPVAACGRTRRQRIAQAMHVRLGEGREREALVGLDLRARRVVHDVEAHAVEVGHLTQFLGELQLEQALARHQLIAAHEHELVVVGRHEQARSHRQSQRRAAEHVRHEPVRRAVPGV
jgi:hypothetical protein